ncbi:hypothetical protein CWATWH0005_4534 [Crocosphaera watsonii WH 0005]|uniref:Uncharacterized protein n=1 Tax=Crocosphaera watsonii WH 0005 TaxID=423472 RepID=T2IX34_CROWT|nr:hypothetical protein CWATWH0005_4534 [Crocosphaera watsonii WH 0005]
MTPTPIRIKLPRGGRRRKRELFFSPIVIDDQIPNTIIIF